MLLCVVFVCVISYITRIFQDNMFYLLFCMVCTSFVAVVCMCVLLSSVFVWCCRLYLCIVVVCMCVLLSSVCVCCCRLYLCVAVVWMCVLLSSVFVCCCRLYVCVVVVCICVLLSSVCVWCCVCVCVSVDNIFIASLNVSIGASSSEMHRNIFLFCNRKKTFETKRLKVIWRVLMVF